MKRLLPLHPRSEEIDPRSARGSFEARHLRVPANAGVLRRLRNDVDDAADAFGLGPSQRHELVVAVNEAATNAIKHGRPYRDGTIVLRIEATDDTLICSVCDRGRFSGGRRQDDPLLESGRGMHLMARCSDRTYISSGPQGTTVRLYKRRRPAVPLSQ